MRMLIQVSWSLFALDTLLGAILIFAAITDKGDAAGRGLAQVYAVACALALLILGAILGLSTFFRSRVGLWISIVLLVTPPLLYLTGIVRRLLSGAL